MRFPNLKIVLLLMPLLLLHGFTTAQDSPFPAGAGELYRFGNPAGSGVYLGEGLFLTSLRSVVAESMFIDENGEIPLYAQGWQYDADGQDDYGEAIFHEYVCSVDGAVRLVEPPTDPSCIPYDLTQIGEPLLVDFLDGSFATVSELVYADRRFDLVLLRLETIPNDAHAAILNAVPLEGDAQLSTSGGDQITMRSSGLSDTPQLVRVWTDRGDVEPVKLTTYATPYQAVEIQIGEEDTPAEISAGTGIFNADGQAVGFVVEDDGDQVFIVPASEWIDDLFAANTQLNSPELGSLLDNTILPPAVDSAESIGDPYTPELGNSGIDVQHYNLTLSADPISATISGTAAITLSLTQPNLVSFSLDLRQRMAVSGVRVNGSEVDFEQGERKLRIFLPEPQPFGTNLDVQIDYGGQLRSVQSPYYPWSPIGAVIDPELPQFAIIAEPDTANTWFPCNDHPLDAATYYFSITVAQPFEAVANGQPSITENADGSRTFDWDMPYPMVSYLAGLAVADYDLIEESAPNGILLRHYLFPTGQPPVNVFSETGLAMETLIKYFGEYPFDTYGHVITPQGGGALENQTMTTMPSWMQDPAEADEVWVFVVHELAHQWFGDSVYLGAWQDIWLNEGFATLSEWLAEESRYGADSVRDTRAWAEDLTTSGDRQTPLAYPLSNEMFGDDSYIKAGLVLHMLRVELGDKVFFPMIQAYAATFAHHPTSTDAFFQFAERYAEQDLTRFRQQWLEQALYPQFLLYWQADENGVQLRLCSGRANQRYWLELPLQFVGENGETYEGSLSLNADDVAHGEAQNLELHFDLPFLIQEVIVDPNEDVLEGIEPIGQDFLPDCEL